MCGMNDIRKLILRFLVLIGCSLAVVVPMQAAESTVSIFGRWLTYNDDTEELDSMVEVYERNGEVRGKVIEIFGTEELDLGNGKYYNCQL